MSLTVTPLDCGSLTEVERSRLQHMEGFGEKLTVATMVWLITGGEFPIVVDAGPGSPELAREFGRVLHQTPDQDPRRAVTLAGVDPDEVAVVVQTHLHWDHALGLELNPFPNAQILVQREELLYTACPYPVHVGLYDHKVPGKVVPTHSQRYENLVEIDGDVTVADGVRVLLTPGHTPGLQTVVVDTGSLVYAIASDNVSLAASWRGPRIDDWVPSGVHVSLEDCYRSMARLADVADVILPSHDPIVFDWLPLATGAPRLGARSGVRRS
jgi:glyoxylase-like metal-dependent hydrolase (beta-lactamase superfamily II)